MTPSILSLPDQLPEGWRRRVDPFIGHDYAEWHLEDEAGVDVATVCADPWRGRVEVHVLDPTALGQGTALARRIAEASRLTFGPSAPVVEDLAHGRESDGAPS